MGPLVLKSPVRRFISWSALSFLALTAGISSGQEQPAELHVTGVVLENPPPKASSAALRDFARGKSNIPPTAARGTTDGIVGVDLSSLIDDVRDLDTRVIVLEKKAEAEGIKIKETSSAFVTLAGNPKDKHYSLLRFLRTDLLDRNAVSIQRLHPSSIQLAAKWLDVANLPRVEDAAILPKEDGQAAQPENRTESQPDARAIRIDWEEPPQEIESFEVTYRSTAPPWTIQYQIDVDSSNLSAARVTPSAFIYNRTAYDWRGVPVTLREGKSDGVEYRIENVKLRSQQAGLFPLAASDTAPWRAEMQRVVRFDASKPPSGAGPRESLKISKLTGPYLVPDVASVFQDGQPYGEAAEIRPGAVFEGPNAPTVSVTFSPTRLAVRSQLTFGVASFEKERLVRSVTQTYTVKNRSPEIVSLTIVLAEPEAGWARDEDKLTVAVPAASGGTPGQKEAVVTYVETDEIDLRIATLEQLKPITAVTPAQFAKLRQIETLREAMDQAAAQHSRAKRRLKILEKAYVDYEVVEDSKNNRFAREALGSEIDKLSREIATLGLRALELQADIDRVIYDPAAQPLPPPPEGLTNPLLPPVLGTGLMQTNNAEWQIVEGNVE